MNLFPMLISFFFFSLPFVATSYGGELFDTLPNQKIQSSSLDTDLKDMPAFNQEVLRYLLPKDNWHKARRYLMKGTILEINLSVIKNYELKFYSSKDFQGLPSFSFKNSELILNNHQSCVWGYDKKYVSNTFQQCSNFSCLNKQTSKPEELNNYEGLNVIFNLKSVNDEESPCPIQLNVSQETNINDENILSIPLTHKENKFGVVSLDKGSVFLDISFCEQHIDACKFTNIPNSMMENAWLNFKQTKNKKNYLALNIFIKDLLPCVQKKNYECVKKYFFTKNDMKKYSSEGDDSFIEQVLNDDVLDDLEHCLNYEQLLPYGGRLRAKNGKLCLFNEKLQKFYSVSLPDAYMFFGGNVKVNYEIK